MIGYLRGRLLRKEPLSVAIEPGEGGIGYELKVPLSTSRELGDEGDTAELLTHLHWTEKGPQLYGFATEPERSAFVVMTSISGIGPTLALKVLSSLSVNELVRAVAEQETAVFTSVKGLGKKRAERLVFELKDSIKKVSEVEESVSYRAVDSLVALGMTPAEASLAVDGALADGGGAMSLEEVVRLALAQARKNR